MRMLNCLLLLSTILAFPEANATSIWGSTDRGPVQGTYRIPVDTSSSSGPGYITSAELLTYINGGFSMAGDCSFSSGTITCTKTGGVLFGSAATQAMTAFLQPSNNLSDLASASTARTNLGLGSAATQAMAAFLQPSNNLSDLVNVATARANLGLAASATTDTTNAANITSGTLAAARLPNPSATTLGGVESIVTVSHQFLTGLSTSGVPSQAQPSFGDISGSFTLSQFPTIAANTVLGNGTGSTALPTALSVPSCPDSGGNHINWVSGTGFTCGTSGGAGGSVSVTASSPNVVVNPSPGTGTFSIGITQPADRLVASGTTDTITSGDAGKLIEYSSSSPVAIGISAANTTGLTQGFAFTVSNVSSQTETITPTSSLINGGSSLTIPPSTGCTIRSDGTNYKVDFSACSALAAASGSAATFTASSSTSFTTSSGTVMGIQPGAALTSTSAGNALNVTAGNAGATSGAGGTLTLKGGNAQSNGSTGGQGGGVVIQGTQGAFTSPGGTIQITAGQAATTGNPNGGSVSIAGGQGGGNGGAVTINGGAGTGGTFSGGAVTVQGGGGGNATNGGVATVQGGNGATSGGTGANAVLQGGNGGSSTGPGGNAVLNGGVPTSGNGGGVTIAGANGVGSNKNGGNIVITPGSATGTGTNGFISMAGSEVHKRTTVADLAYTVLTTDYIVAYTSLTAARTATLPTCTSAGEEFIIADETGSAGTNNITVAGTIDGVTNKVINTNYGSLRVYCITGTTYKTF